MFDFLFGGNRKLELIRGLVEQRLQDEGYSDVDSRLKTKEMSNVRLSSTPEAAIVSILETVIKFQRQGALIGQILLSIENHRKTLGEAQSIFKNLMALACSSSEKAGEAIPMYVIYRLNIEHPHSLDIEQITRAFGQTVQELSR